MDLRTTFGDPALGATATAPRPERRSPRVRVTRLPRPSLPRPSLPRPSARALRGAALGLALLVTVAATGGWWLLQRWAGQVDRLPAFGATDERPAETGTTNVLLVGSDSREGLTRAERRRLSTGRDECDCTDTLMLLQLGGDGSSTLVSLPRDLMVRTPGWRDADGVRHPARLRQINAAYGAGGLPLTVATVESLTGVRVDHVLQVRFSGVVRVVDALGGVDVCVPRPFEDRRTHLALDAGTHRLDGVDALKYVRLRYVGSGSDLDRVRRQQQFLAAALDRATSVGVLADPRRLARLVSATADSIAVDDETSDVELIALADRLRSLDRSRTVMFTVPDEPWVQDPNRAQLARPAADRVFAALRGERPLVPPRDAAKAERRKGRGDAVGGTDSEHRTRADRPSCTV